MANSLSGNLSTSPVTNSYMHMASGGFHRSDSSNSINSNSGEITQPGIVTIVDVQVCRVVHKVTEALTPGVPTFFASFYNINKRSD